MGEPAMVELSEAIEQAAQRTNTPGIVAIGLTQEFQSVFTAYVRRKDGSSTAPSFTFVKADRRVSVFYFYPLDLRRALAAGNPDTYLPDLAVSLNNHAMLLAETGQEAETMASAIEATSLFQQLATTDPGTFAARAERLDKFVTELRGGGSPP